MRTQVTVLGAGPAGLMLSHLLALAGIDSVVLETRDRATIESTIRAGVLEPGTVELMCQAGVGDRVLAEGARHDGIELRFAGRTARIDLAGLTGRSVWLYPQHEVLKDLIAARLDAGGDVRFGVTDVALSDPTTDAPRVSFTDADGAQVTLESDVVAGCDGSGGPSRSAIPPDARTDHFRAYPFGWFGILAEAPRSSDELIYAHSPRGFALVSTRTASVQRMYFQCDPREQADDWTDEQIWAELQARVAGDGFRLREGRIFERTVIPMRSYVCEPMQHGRLFLAGDSAHTVPPTGAKGLNLAMADARVLAQALEVFFASGRSDLLERYGETALSRVWRAQHFSWWMTSMLHRADDASPFDLRRQLGELELVTGTTAGSTYLAEAYVGWPKRPR
jgi:p-hydroxybenzoate 3-monooxygenase